MSTWFRKGTKSVTDRSLGPLRETVLQKQYQVQEDPNLNFQEFVPGNCRGRFYTTRNNCGTRSVVRLHLSSAHCPVLHYEWYTINNRCSISTVLVSTTYSNSTGTVVGCSGRGRRWEFSEFEKKNCFPKFWIPGYPGTGTRYM
eukprot:3353773-Rhodomonas_salina.1